MFCKICFPLSVFIDQLCSRISQLLLGYWKEKVFHDRFWELGKMKEWVLYSMTQKTITRMYRLEKFPGRTGKIIPLSPFQNSRLLWVGLDPCSLNLQDRIEAVVQMIREINCDGAGRWRNGNRDVEPMFYRWPPWTECSIIPNEPRQQFQAVLFMIHLLTENQGLCFYFWIDFQETMPVSLIQIF